MSSKDFPSKTKSVFVRFLIWTLLLMFSPIIVGLFLAVVGSILDSRGIMEMAGIMWFTFVTVPAGVAILIFYGLVRLLIRIRQKHESEQRY